MPIVPRDGLSVPGLVQTPKFLQSKTTERSICHARPFASNFKEQHMVSKHKKG
jgi:hypothetical protein